MRDVKLMKQETEKVLKRLGLDLDPGTPVSETECWFVSDGRKLPKPFPRMQSILVFE